MRRLIAASVVLAVPLTACAPRNAADAHDHDHDSAPAVEAQKAQPIGRLGDALTVSGRSIGARLRVTVRKVVETRSTDRSAVLGHRRLVAVQLELVNRGEFPYNDAPSNSAAVISRSGQAFPADAFYQEIDAGQQLPVQVRLAPGARIVGYLVFPVPDKVTIAQVQFSTDPGADGTAVWDVR